MAVKKKVVKATPGRNGVSKRDVAPGRSAPDKGVAPEMDAAPAQDAVDMLTADHRRVAKLFAEFEALKEEGTDEEKSSIVARICEELTVHTALEEEIFYPAVRKAIGDDDLMDEAIVEHAGAKNLIAQLQAADPDDELYDAKVTVLGEQIDHHVTEEEGSMFPQAKGKGVDTLSLGGEMLARKSELAAKPAPPPKDAGRTAARKKTSHEKR